MHTTAGHWRCCHGNTRTTALSHSQVAAWCDTKHQTNIDTPSRGCACPSRRQRRADASVGANPHRGRGRDLVRDSLDFFCSSSVSEPQLLHPAISSYWHSPLSQTQQRQPQRNCLRMKRNQRDWRAVQAAVYHTTSWPCRSTRREPAPGSADPTPVSRSAPCCCGRPHECLCSSPIFADREACGSRREREAVAIDY